MSEKRARKTRQAIRWEDPAMAPVPPPGDREARRAAAVVVRTRGLRLARRAAAFDRDVMGTRGT